MLKLKGNAATSDEETLNPFRNRIIRTATIVSVVTVAALIFTARHQPLAGTDGRLGLTTYAVLTQILSTVLSIGVLALIWEWFLRRDYARSLYRYLGLKSALVSSGLQAIHDPNRTQSQVVGAIERASIIRAVCRNPSQWATRYLGAVTAAAADREVHVELIFPDYNSTDNLGAMARSQGLTASSLRSSIDSAVEIIKNGWSQTNLASKNSTISIAAIELPLYDLLIADSVAIVEIFSATDHQPGKAGIMLEFAGNGEKVAWVQKQIDDASLVPGELWAAAPAGQSNYFRG